MQSLGFSLRTFSSAFQFFQSLIDAFKFWHVDDPQFEPEKTLFMHSLFDQPGLVHTFALQQKTFTELFLFELLHPDYNLL